MQPIAFSLNIFGNRQVISVLLTLYLVENLRSPVLSPSRQILHALEWQERGVHELLWDMLAN